MIVEGRENSENQRVKPEALSVKEREFIERVKKLEAQVRIREKIKQLREKRLELQAEIEALREKSRNYHEELTERAEESQRLHERMLERIKEVKKVKTEADGMHQNFLKIREKVRAKNSEMAVILNQIKRLRQEIRKEEEEKRKKSEEALRKKIEKHVEEKLKRGEKLTWEEFKILTEKDSGKQD
ncbi:hypothetical protein DRO59_02335 [Candidatus Bathyarchaeota archaeon]|nr:MAG: hypothetical protein DRO59_02335 [Candidatus Bathyarchaeota archaeon]